MAKSAILSMFSYFIGVGMLVYLPFCAFLIFLNFYPMLKLGFEPSIFQYNHLHCLSSVECFFFCNSINSLFQVIFLNCEIGLKFYLLMSGNDIILILHQRLFDSLATNIVCVKLHDACVSLDALIKIPCTRYCTME